MKRKIFTAMVCCSFLFSSCATILGGRIDSCQRRKPGPGEETRKIRVAPLIFDLLLTGVIGAGIDFATCAIYKPCPPAKAAQTVK